VASNTSSTKTVADVIKDSASASVRQTVQSEEQLHAHLQRLRLEDEISHKQRRLLDSLHFDNIYRRQNAIQQHVGRYGNTFKWIFQSDDLHHFPGWLVSGNGIYWISGKPGSGKSSLVDYILHQFASEASCRKLLEQWASPDALLILSFFFYSPAGDELQKGFEGLWRSLCFQILSKDQDLLKDLVQDSNAPDHVRRQIGLTTDVKLPWLTRDLEQVFFYLVQRTKRKIFILIDGLDEFAQNHLRLLDTIQKLALVPRLKLCCSSRPDQPFLSALNSGPSLRLQDFTRDDIEMFVIDQLRDTKAKGLVDSIVDGAEGVFLWASLIAHQIRRGVSEGASIEELRILIHDVSNHVSNTSVSLILEVSEYADVQNRHLET
jgi:hypothetical protein